MEPRISYGGLFALPSTTALPLLLPNRCALAVPRALLKGELGMEPCRPRGSEQLAQTGNSESSQSLRASTEPKLQDGAGGPNRPGGESLLCVLGQVIWPLYDSVSPSRTL